MGGRGFLIDHPWPKFDPKYLVSETLDIAVQVNGKLRGLLQAPASADDSWIKTEAQKLEKVQAHMAGKAVRKIIYVPRKLVNIVV